MPSTDGPVHAYVTTSPECWALFAGAVGSQPERMFTDAYMAQHPDGDDPRQIQSVASHLIALESVLVRGQPRTKTEEILVAAIGLGRRLGGFSVLDRPQTWKSTILDVLDGRTSPTDYVWDVLRAWHDTEASRINDWTDQTLQAMYG